MPVIRTQNCVVNLEPGDELEALCTDPGALTDIPAWCRIEGHEVVQSGERDSEFFVRLRVAQSSVIN